MMRVVSNGELNTLREQGGWEEYCSRIKASTDGGNLRKKKER